MTAAEPASEGLVEYASKEWCEKATEVWMSVTYPNLVDPDNYNYTVEWGDVDSGKCSQLVADHGKIVTWEPEKKMSDEELTFIIWAKSDIWKKLGEGKLDPVGAVASKRLHVRKGPMPVVIKEADAFKNVVVGMGQIPTKY